MNDKNFFRQQRHLLPPAMVEALRKNFGVVDIEELAPSLEQWFATPLGASLLQAEQEMIDKALSYLFGYHLVQLSVVRRAKLYSNSKINHCFGLHPMGGDQSIFTGQCQFDQLPLDKASVDVALLHHVIDFAAQPHRLLREVVRAVAPHGHIVIVGFNPLSPLGVSRMFSRYTFRKPYQRSHAIRVARVVDWLRLLDCEPVGIETGYFRMPINSQFFIDKSQWFEPLGEHLLSPFGGFYMIIARKEQGAAIPIKPQWQSVNSMNGFSVSKVASKVSHAANQPGKIRPFVRSGGQH
ncbi:class I SAM-dependent methyltransferase [Halioxenophilus sp. WMMB6]|uniref:class I SAM-dependent methyltransferase n=1 Tax=Halioxenophilus sp. WMMB6 TaxID=3073815 RepID=UPI00295E2B29|nr:methyltransferase domain-containing protein [Halioxenophilus sp. WMMB6]